MEHIFLKSFHVAGFTYYEGAFVFNELKIGTKIDLIYEEGNVHDDFAVELRYKGKKLGYIPREQNKEIAIILKAGHEIFDAVVQQISKDTHPEKQVRVGVFVKTKRKSKSKKTK